MTEAKRAANARYRAKVILETVAAYGGQCSCGETNVNVLQLHHKDGNGNAHREALFNAGHASPGGWHFYVKLRALGFPPGYELKCPECNPHKCGNPFSGRGSKRSIQC